ncbi:hypothetical protein [Lacrimispora sp.]|uniref:hypothetical protein n=1 Tax=Lacrimispora sp. TaxID=2719234 RepID=UPI0028A887B3|nr:hypothetical protein [Lacrimispora sp.]
MKEYKKLCVNIDGFLTLASFILDQSESNLVILQETLSECQEGQRTEINKCVFHQLCDVIDLMVILEDTEKTLNEPSIPYEFQLSLANLKIRIESLISNYKTVENALCDYALCPLITNGSALN